MKKIILLIAAAAFVGNTYAQTNVEVKTSTTPQQGQTQDQTIEVKSVPQVVVSKFQSTYPDVNGVTWRKVGSYYVANYDNNNTYIEYDPSGSVVESGQSVDITSAPSQVNTYVTTKYKDDHIKRIYKVKDSSGKTIWKAKTKSGYYYIDDNGNYIKMEKD